MSLKVDMSKFNAGVKRLLAESEEKKHRALLEIGWHGEGESKDRAPFDAGTLTHDIESDVQGDAAVIRVPVNAPSSRYAVKMHEGDYNLGEGSVNRQTKTGKQVGNKYITRAIDDSRDDFKDIIIDNMKV